MMDKYRCGHGTSGAFCFHNVIQYLELEETSEIVLTRTPISHTHNHNLRYTQMWKISLEK